MNFPEILEEFIKKQKENGVSTKEITEAIFVAFNVCIFKTLKDLKEISSEDKWKDFISSSEKIKEVKTMEDYKEFVSKNGDLVVDDSGRTFRELMEGNLVEFFNRIGEA